MRKIAFYSILIFIALINFPACSGVFYAPDNNFYFPPEQNGYHAEDIYFTTSDNKKLHAWFFPALRENGKGTIVQFHGNAENISSHYASLVWITKHGYDLFVFDYRGYGLSEGKANQEGTHFDALAALDWAWARHNSRKNKQFVVYGQSLGGVIAARAVYDFSHKEKIDLLVLDSTFYSYKDIAQEKLASIWLTWLISPLGQILVSDKYASKKILPSISTRTLVIHDKLDPIVSYKNGQYIYEKLKSPKDFWVLEKKSHVGIFAVDTIENRDKFLAFLTEPHSRVDLKKTQN